MKPIVYEKNQHKIKIEDIDPDALHIIEVLQANGYSAYLVGGGVRDLLLNYTPKDFDISTDALPEEVKSLFPFCFLVGKRFRLAHVRMHHKTFEVSTFRKGDNSSDVLIYNDNEWGTEVDDVLRRDFTVNGLFYDPKSEAILDYVGGVKDAKKNLLHCIGDPYIRFKQDPVRMIRLLKFRARFGLKPQPKMIDALKDLKEEILKSSPMRILEEILKMLESGSSLPFMKILLEHDVFSIMFPNFANVLTEEIVNSIFSFLTEVDSSILNENKRAPKRAFLVACLVFPVFQKHIQILYEKNPKKTHLAKIHHEAFNLTAFLFDPHIKITKKILSEAAEILFMQYLFTPLSKRKKQCKIPKSKRFSQSLKFFALRASLEPGLTEIYNEWMYYYKKHKKQNDSPKRKQRIT